MAELIANNLKLNFADDGSTPVVLTNSVSVEFSSSTDMYSVVTKDSAGVNEVKPGLQSSTMTVSGIAYGADGENVDRVLTAYLAKELQDFTFVDGTNTLISGSGYWNDFSTTTGTDDKVDFSGTLTTTGTITNGIA